MKKLVLVIAALVGGALHVCAQSASTGTMIGTVTDPSGAVVPAAKIDLQDVTTGVSRSAITNSAGSIPLLEFSRVRIL